MNFGHRKISYKHFFQWCKPFGQKFATIRGSVIYVKRKLYRIGPSGGTGRLLLEDSPDQMLRHLFARHHRRPLVLRPPVGQQGRSLFGRSDQARGTTHGAARGVVDVDRRRIAKDQGCQRLPAR